MAWADGLLIIENNNIYLMGWVLAKKAMKKIRN
jgi:hypothetical protein